MKDGVIMLERVPDRCPPRRSFVVLPRRWNVERTLGWIMKARRNVRDYERLPQYSEAHLTWALITLMTRRITRKGPHASWSKRVV
ncbi:transposase [Streptomyces anulatus]|uniref:Transposase n=1 Tax=Streptomyces anulatus TaxID=1892 RepID=A0A7K3RNA5_STRAQ|nr:transposase [Streptomyces anulatus]NED30716.1 transposase [Streptomyces anulatus]